MLISKCVVTGMVMLNIKVTCSLEAWYEFENEYENESEYENKYENEYENEYEDDLQFGARIWIWNLIWN